MTEAGARVIFGELAAQLLHLIRSQWPGEIGNVPAQKNNLNIRTQREKKNKKNRLLTPLGIWIWYNLH